MKNLLFHRTFSMKIWKKKRKYDIIKLFHITDIRKTIFISVRFRAAVQKGFYALDVEQRLPFLGGKDKV